MVLACKSSLNGTRALQSMSNFSSKEVDRDGKTDVVNHDRLVCKHIFVLCRPNYSELKTGRLGLLQLTLPCFTVQSGRAAKGQHTGSKNHIQGLTSSKEFLLPSMDDFVLTIDSEDEAPIKTITKKLITRVVEDEVTLDPDFNFDPHGGMDLSWGLEDVEDTVQVGTKPVRNISRIIGIVLINWLQKPLSVDDIIERRMGLQSKKRKRGSSAGTEDSDEGSDVDEEVDNASEDETEDGSEDGMYSSNLSPYGLFTAFTRIWHGRGRQRNRT